MQPVFGRAAALIELPAAIAIIALHVLVCESRADESADVIRSIQRAWSAREASVKSLVCNWTETRIDGAGKDGVTEHDGSTSYWPKSDVTYQWQCRLWMNGDDQIRYDTDGPRFTHQTKSHEPRNFVSVQNTEKVRTFFSGDPAEGENSRFYPFGMIYKSPRIAGLSSMNLLPILLIYRPSTKEIVEGTVDVTKYAYRGTVDIGDASCLRLEMLAQNGATRALFVDPQKDYVPIRYASMGRGPEASGELRVYNQMDTFYQRAEDGQWVPSGWKHAIFGPKGEVIEQAEATVVRLEMNAPIPADVFEFEFPPGTVVNDDKAEQYFLLRDSGEKRHITRAEQEHWVPYQRLLATESGYGVESISNNRRWSWIIASNGLIVVALLVVWYWRSRPAHR